MQSLYFQLIFKDSNGGSGFFILVVIVAAKDFSLPQCHKSSSFITEKHKKDSKY